MASIPPKRSAAKIWAEVSTQIEKEFSDRAYTLNKKPIINAVNNLRAELNVGSIAELKKPPLNQISLEDERVIYDFHVSFRVENGMLNLKIS
jgi:hypothetical protein